MVLSQIFYSCYDCGVDLEEEDPSILDGVVPNPNLLTLPRLSRPKTCVVILCGPISDNTNSRAAASNALIFDYLNKTLQIKQLKHMYSDWIMKQNIKHFELQV